MPPAVITVPTESTHFRANESGCSLFIIRIVIKRVIVQFIEIKKFCQCHIEGKGYLMERFHSWILGKCSYNIIKSGLLYITHNSQWCKIGMTEERICDLNGLKKCEIFR